jgi:ABC-type proline/glycine betaine transport system permease subunit
LNLLSGHRDEWAKTGIRQDAMSNSSMFTADRMTHLKIVVVSLICATIVAGIGISARVTDSATANGRLESTVIKAGPPLTASTGGNTIR